MNYLKQIFNSKTLRRKIFYTLALLFVYRLLTQLTVPGVDSTMLDLLKNNQSGALGVFSLLTGGSAENFSIVLMGLSPYINASIIVQLLSVIVPKFEALSKEGQQGRKVLNKYTRWLTLPIAFLQSYGMLVLMNSQIGRQLVNIGDFSVVLPMMLSITAGTMFLMWIGELITERGIGNGISLIIFTSIVAGLPQIVSQYLASVQNNPEELIPFTFTILITIALIVLIVYVSEGARKIPITYTGQKIRSNRDRSFIPIRVNQAGMIPIIFAISLITFPSIVGQFLRNVESSGLKSVAETIIQLFTPGSASYIIIFGLLIIFFTFFYVEITFQPKQVAENIQKRGGYIPGIRPGRYTAEYIAKVSRHLNLFGGLFLAFVAILPMALNALSASNTVTPIQSLINGAGLIIIVGVILELVRQIDAQLLMQDYDKLKF